MPPVNGQELGRARMCRLFMVVVMNSAHGGVVMLGDWPSATATFLYRAWITSHIYATIQRKGFETRALASNVCGRWGDFNARSGVEVR